MRSRKSKIRLLSVILAAVAAFGAAFLVMAIVGGAILPVLQGMIADASAIQWSFALPVLCYFYICFYGWKGSAPTDAV